jgi:3-oxoacyl-[acyl-carrier-protein] synthase II
MRRVAITGLGAVSPFGAGVKAYWSGLAAGACAIRAVSLFSTEGFRCRLAAEVPDVAGSWRRSRADRLALAAATEALDDAHVGRHERADMALAVGAVGGGMLEAEEWYWARAGKGERPGRLAALRSILPSSHAEVVANRLGIHGPRETVVTACSSGGAALALAAELISDGIVDVALAGGTDALTRICYMGFNALKLLDPEPCRPFDAGRRGMSIGEGAGFAVLEEATRARARGVRVYGELVGHGMTTDAYHVTAPQPDGEGMARAMRTALRRGGVAPADVGYVNAHGTATLQNDRIEARELREVFGEERVLVSSTKSMIGHTMAAAGALEAVATILALAHELLPPTANHEVRDPDVVFDCIPTSAREASVEHAISNSFGFGGQNLTLLFRRS